MAQRSRSVLLVACLVAASLHPLLIAGSAFLGVARPTNGLDTAKRGSSILGVTARMAIPSEDGTTATTEAQRAQALRLPPKTVTSKDAERALQRPQSKQGSWTFKAGQSGDPESADDDGDSELATRQRAALRLPGAKEEAERALKRQSQEELEALYEINGSTEDFTLPEQIAYFAGAAAVMWIWIVNAYRTFEHFGSGPHL